MEIDTESIKIDEELANLGSKLSLKLAKNWVCCDLAFRGSSDDFIDLDWPEMDSAGLKMWKSTPKSSKSDKKWPF